MKGVTWEGDDDGRVGVSVKSVDPHTRLEIERIGRLHFGRPSSAFRAPSRGRGRGCIRACAGRVASVVARGSSELLSLRRVGALGRGEMHVTNHARAHARLCGGGQLPWLEMQIYKFFRPLPGLIGRRGLRLWPAG
jgi:hypothetical protein